MANPFDELAFEDIFGGTGPEEDEDVLEGLTYLQVPTTSLTTEGTLQTQEAPADATEGFVQSIFNTLNEIKEDPVRGLPFALETAGAVLGGLGTGGFGAPVGAFTGRLIGETIESFVRDTPLFTGENAFEAIAAPIFSLPFSTVAGVGKAIKQGAKQKLSRVAETTLDPFIAPRGMADLIKKAEAEVLDARTAKYLEEPAKVLEKTVKPGKVLEESAQYLDDESLGRDLVGEALTRLQEPSRYVPEGLYVIKGDPVGNLLDATKKARDRVAQGKKPGTLRELLDEGVIVDPVDSPGRALEDLLGTTEEGLGLKGRGVGRAGKSVDTSILDDTDYVGQLLTKAEQVQKKQSLTELTQFFGVQDEVNRSLERLSKTGTQVQRAEAKLTIHRELAERKAILDSLPKIPDSLNNLYLKQKSLVAIGESRNVPGAGPLLREGKQIGLGEQLVGASRVLTKYNNPEGILVRDAAEVGDAYRRQVSETLNARFMPVFEKYGLGEGRLDVYDQVALNILHKKPVLRQQVLDGTATIKGFDPEKIKRLAGFMDEVTTEVRDPALLLARRSALNPHDPSKPLAGLPDEPVNRNLFASTSISGRNVDIALDDLHRSEALLKTLPDDSPMRAYLDEQIPTLQKQLEIAKTSNASVERRLVDAADFAESTGQISKDAFVGAFKESDEKLLLGSDILGNFQEYIDSLARKTALDNSQVVMAGAMRRLGDINLMANNLALDQIAKLKPDDVIDMANELMPGLVNSFADQGDIKPIAEALTGFLAKTPGIRQQAEKVLKDQRPLRDYVAKFIQAQNGQMRQSAVTRMADTFRRLPFGIGEHITPAQVSNALQTINNAVYVLDIGLNPRFMFQNTTQPLVTLMPAVGMDTFSKAMMETMTDFSNIAARAKAAGTIIGDKNLAEELGIKTASGNKLFKAINFLPETTEKINRVLAHRAGELQAEAMGLVGDAAQQHAKNLSTMVNFGLTTTDRPLITNSPIGSMLFRFRSYASGYATFMYQLAKTNPKAAADAVVMMTSLGGTTGIPLYDFVREAAANLGGTFLPEIPGAIEGGTGELIEAAQQAWPELDVLTQLQALDMGRSMAFPWQYPNQPAEFFGPIGAPIINATTALARGDTEEFIQALKQGAGPLLGRLPETLGQIATSGETRTGGGQLIGVRDPIEIAQTAVSFRPNVRQERAQLRRDLELALDAGDQKTIRDLLKMARAKGLKNVGMLLSQAKSNQSRGENTSALSVLFGL